jgi:hypothetical protein
MDRATSIRAVDGRKMQVVIAGLDPAIHQSSEKVVARRMDARVKPAHDDLAGFALARD